MADLRFRAWAQSAVASAQRPDGSGEVTPHIAVKERSAPSPLRLGPKQGIRLLGPAGVIGLDAAAVVRTDPVPGATEVQSNCLACIEFSIPELPWVMTPRPAAGTRLDPWIVLVVVEDDTPLDAARQPPVLTVAPKELPRPSTSAAWAHIQEPDPGLRLPPGVDFEVRPVSRLMCPRRLEDGKRYRACVVPAFKGGLVAAGLVPAQSVDANAPAWDVNARDPVQLPVYYHWEFATGTRGDFEQLVGRLVAQGGSPPAVGGALLADITRPLPHVTLGTAAERETPQTVAVQGALRPLGPTPAGSAGASVRAELEALLTSTLTATGDRLRGERESAPPDTVGPPIYGGGHVARDDVSPAGDWLGELNLTPANRIAAGLGAEYVRANQEELMSQEWAQVGQVREANRLRAIGQLNAEVAGAVHRKHIANLAPGELLAVAAPAAMRTRAGVDDPPLAMRLAVSPLPDPIASTACARLLRTLGPVGRAAGATLEALVERGLAGELPQTTPLARRVDPPDLPAPDGPLERAVEEVLRSVDADALARQVVMLGAVRDVAAVRGLDRDDAVAALSEGVEGIERIEDLEPAVIRSTDRAAGRRLRQALAAAAADRDPSVEAAREGFGLLTRDSPVVSSAGLRTEPDELRGQVVALLAPGDRVARRLASRIRVPAATDRERASLEPVMRHPSFSRPAALTLRETAPEWFLRGLGEFPLNRAALVEPNDAFVESYLVGLNHELMRELNWREYPTDLRGTPFAHFWPRPDARPDIPPIHEWEAGSRLGTHLELSERSLSALVVRADVVRSFPQLVVAAARVVGESKPDPDPRRWEPPLFVITIDEATVVYGFELSEEQLLGPPGWFLVFHEHSQSLRFGFDVRDEPLQPQDFKSWNDLAWPSGGGAGEVPMDRVFADAAGVLDPQPPASGPLAQAGARWGTDAADVARIALQMPVRAAIHARALIGA